MSFKILQMQTMCIASTWIYEFLALDYSKNDSH
jgi:hypothetical protein